MHKASGQCTPLHPSTPYCPTGHLCTPLCFNAPHCILHPSTPHCTPEHPNTPHCTLAIHCTLHPSIPHCTQHPSTARCIGAPSSVGATWSGVGELPRVPSLWRRDSDKPGWAGAGSGDRCPSAAPTCLEGPRGPEHQLTNMPPHPLAPHSEPLKRGPHLWAPPFRQPHSTLIGPARPCSAHMAGG